MNNILTTVDLTGFFSRTLLVFCLLRYELRVLQRVDVNLQCLCLLLLFICFFYYTQHRKKLDQSILSKKRGCPLGRSHLNLIGEKNVCQLLLTPINALSSFVIYKMVCLKMTMSVLIFLLT